MIGRWLRRRRYMREHGWSHAHLSEYLDGELSEEERLRLEEHTRICPGCDRILATLRRTIAALAGARLDPDPDLAEMIVGRLRNEPPHRG